MLKIEKCTSVYWTYTYKTGCNDVTKTTRYTLSPQIPAPIDAPHKDQSLWASEFARRGRSGHSSGGWHPRAAKWAAGPVRNGPSLCVTDSHYFCEVTIQTGGPEANSKSCPQKNRGLFFSLIISGPGPRPPGRGPLDQRSRTSTPPRPGACTPAHAEIWHTERLIHISAGGPLRCLRVFYKHRKKFVDVKIYTICKCRSGSCVVAL